MRTAMVSALLAVAAGETSLERIALECRSALMHDSDELWLGDLTPFSLRFDEAPTLALDCHRAASQLEPAALARLAPPKGAVYTTTADRFERFLQAYEYAHAGALKLGSLLDFTGPTDGFTDAMVQFISATADAREFDSFPQASISEFYDASDYYYQMLLFARDHGDQRIELIDDAVSSRVLRVTKPLNVCDVGCGTANLGLHIAIKAEAASLTRIDINRDALRSVPAGRLKRVIVHNYLADFAKRWPVPTDSQDIVILGEVLEHCFSPRWLIQESARVLRGGGQLLVTIPNAWHWRKIARFLLRQRLERNVDSEHIRHFSARTLKELLRVVPLTVDKVIHFSLRWLPKDSIIGRVHRLYSRLPFCAWNYFVIASMNRQTGKTPQEALNDEAGQVVTFLMNLQPGKRLPFVRNKPETLFQATFRIAATILLLPNSCGLKPDNLCLAALFRALIEARIGEYSPTFRAELVRTKATALLEEALAPLPDSMRKSLINLHTTLVQADEWALLACFFNFEYQGARHEYLRRCFGEKWESFAREAYGFVNP
jgi:SAM-dependent methyltransferase